MKHESRARTVTFFEDRARVERVATVSCAPGVHTLRLLGISALADDSSVVVTSSHGEVKGARIERFMETPTDGDSEREELEREVQRRRAEADQASQEQGRLEIQVSQLQRFEQELIDHLAHVPSSQGIEIASWQDATDNIGGRMEGLLQELRAATRANRKAHDRLHRAQQRLRDAQGKEPRMKATLEVQLECPDDGEVEITAHYFVPCALWRPSHRATRPAEAPDTLEIVTLATVWQRTGERWEGIEAFFSTARLSKPATAPTLVDDYLSSRPKSPEEKKSIQAEFRDQIIEELEGGPRQSVDEMPGIDDGGRPLVFSAERPVTIESTGDPVRVECYRQELAAEVERVAFAEIMEAPHLVARANWTGDQPLLAGPVELIRGREFAGRSRLDFVAAGDPFRLGFGPDGSVRIQRRVDEETDRSKLTGKQTRQRKVHLYLSNLSGDEQSFELVERVPVSELAEIKIIVDDHRPDRDGFIRIPITLSPNEVRQITFQYRIEMGSQVQLSV